MLVDVLLYKAAEMGHVGYVEATRVLTELGADVNTVDSDGHTPVFVATDLGQPEAISTLAGQGADVNTPMVLG